MRTRLQFISLAIIGASTVWSSTTAHAAEPDGRAILLGMANQLAAASEFSVDVHCGYDVVQEDGQKIEFSESRKILIKRPDGLKVDVEHSNGERQIVTFDGKRISVLSDPQNVYAQVERSGTIDDAVAYFVHDLKMRLPLAMMLVSRLPDELEKRVESVEYVEHTRLLDQPAHHLAARTASVDFQVWVSDGDTPLPLRVVITYKNADSMPQFRGDFTAWNLAPALTTAAFSFAPPADAGRINFLTQMPLAASSGDKK